jgi:hypothetical protein
MNEQESKKSWKVFLEPNKLTENQNDFVAIVSTAGETRTIGDIVREFGTRGTEFQLESIESLLLQGNRIISDFLLAGYAVNTGLVSLHPRVLGPWEGNGGAPQRVHRLDENANSHILARVNISTEDGAKYRLRIVTRYTVGTTLLKEPRTIEYRLLLFRD